MEFKEFVESIVFIMFLLTSSSAVILGIHPYHNFIVSLRRTGDIKQRNPIWGSLLIISLALAFTSGCVLWMMNNLHFKL